MGVILSQQLVNCFTLQVVFSCEGEDHANGWCSDTYYYVVGLFRLCAEKAPLVLAWFTVQCHHSEDHVMGI